MDNFFNDLPPWWVFLLATVITYGLLFHLQIPVWVYLLCGFVLYGLANFPL